MQRRLAIIGGGSSGLITLRYALEELAEWEICCFEKTSDIVGCWGNPPPGFVSTSTRYTTQFSCFQSYEPVVLRDNQDCKGTQQCPDFFNGSEYGRYLTEFADTFRLRSHIRLNSIVTAVEPGDEGWKLTIDCQGETHTEEFSAVVFCTGLVNQIRPLECSVETLRTIDPEQPIENRTIVVIGGGESGVDMAHRLAQPEMGNNVFLSLRSGIRVSPRYHPIRGVPSDFLRNRLLLSFHPGLRNTLGELFVRFRISFRKVLERMFPGSAHSPPPQDASAAERRRYWDLALTNAARDQLFNVYHNKSDDFLDDVGAGRLQIIGAPASDDYRRFRTFDQSGEVEVDPDLIVPAIGFRAGLDVITGGRIRPSDFFLGCVHTEYDNLFAIGFTRPVIGNIPTISEMQARYVCGQISGRYPREPHIQEVHQQERQTLSQRYRKLDTENVYPVEMFPYCDQLARRMQCYPSFARIGSLSRWARMMLCPATTIHYSDEYLNGTMSLREPIHLPWTFTFIMLLLKPVDWLWKACAFLRQQLRTLRAG